jgi:hypothetical protein
MAADEKQKSKTVKDLTAEIFSYLSKRDTITKEGVWIPMEADQVVLGSKWLLFTVGYEINGFLCKNVHIGL